MQSIDLLLESAREFLHQVAAFLPRLLLALVVVADRMAALQGGAVRRLKRGCAPSISQC